MPKVLAFDMAETLVTIALHNDQGLGTEIAMEPSEEKSPRSYMVLVGGKATAGLINQAQSLGVEIILCTNDGVAGESASHRHLAFLKKYGINLPLTAYIGVDKSLGSEEGNKTLRLEKYCHQKDIKPTEVLFFDDSKANIESADQAGFQTCRVDMSDAERQRKTLLAGLKTAIENAQTERKSAERIITQPLTDSKSTPPLSDRGKPPPGDLTPQPRGNQFKRSTENLMEALQHGAEAVAAWFRDQKEIPVSLQRSPNPGPNSFRRCRQLKGVFLELFFSGEPPVLNELLLERYLQGTRLAIQEILQTTVALPQYDTQKLLHLTLAYGQALYFCKKYHGRFSATPHLQQIQALRQSELDQCSRFLAEEKNKTGLKHFIQHGSPILLHQILQNLIKSQHTEEFIAFLEQGLSPNLSIQPTWFERQPLIITFQQQTLLEHAMQEGAHPIVLALLGKGANVNLLFNPKPWTPPSAFSNRLLFVYKNLQKLKSQELKDRKSKEISEINSLEESTANNPNPNKIRDRFLLSYYILRPKDIGKESLALFHRLGIHPSLKPAQHGMQWDYNFSATWSKQIVSFYLANLLVFASASEWDEMFSATKNPEYSQTLFLTCLMAYHKKCQTVSNPQELQHYKDLLIREAKADKDYSKSLIKFAFIKQLDHATQLLIEACGRLNTEKDFWSVFSFRLTEDSERLPSFTGEDFNAEELASFIRTAVSIDRHNYSQFVAVASVTSTKLYQALMLLKQSKTGESFIDPELIDFMLKAIGKNKNKTQNRSHLQCLIDAEREEEALAFLDATGYDPAEDKEALPLFIQEMIPNTTDKMLFLFPIVFPEEVSTFEPVITEIVKNPPENYTSSPTLRFKAYVELTLALAARPENPLEAKAMMGVLEELEMPNGRIIRIPQSIAGIIIEYLPKMGNYPEHIWPHLQPHLPPYPSQLFDNYQLSLQTMFPRHKVTHENGMVQLDLFLRHFGHYVVDYTKFLTLSWIGSHFSEGNKEFSDYFTLTLYHKTITLNEFKPLDIPANSHNRGRPVATFLRPYVLTGRFPTEDLSIKRKIIYYQHAHKILFELGYHDRNRLSEKQLLALKDYADIYPTELLLDAAEQKNMGLLDFLVADTKHQGLSVDINVPINVPRKSTSFWTNLWGIIQPNALILAIEKSNSHATQQLLLKKASLCNRDSLRATTAFLKKARHLDTYLEGIAGALSESKPQNDPSLHDHLVNIAFEALHLAVRISGQDLAENKVFNALLNNPEIRQKAITTSYHQQTLLAAAIQHQHQTVINLLTPIPQPLEYKHQQKSSEEKKPQPSNIGLPTSSELQDRPLNDSASEPLLSSTWSDPILRSDDNPYQGFHPNRNHSQSEIKSLGLSPVKSAPTPWWENPWILPILLAAEGLELGERIFAPWLGDHSFTLLGIHFIAIVPTSLAGFLLGYAMHEGIKTHGPAAKEKLPSFLSIPPVLIALLASSIAGAPIAVECNPLLIAHWPILQNYSAETFIALVLLTGVLTGILTAGKYYYSQSRSGMFCHQNKPVLPSSQYLPNREPKPVISQ